MSAKKLITAIIICITLSAVMGFSQNVSATLSGTVKDPAGAVIPSAQVTLTNQATQVAAISASNAAGIFVFPSLLPGTYTLTVSTSGFRTLIMKDISIAVNERRSFGNLTLEIGEIQHNVEITAEVTPVQTASSERAGLVTSGHTVLACTTHGHPAAPHFYSQESVYEEHENCGDSWTHFAPFPLPPFPKIPATSKGGYHDVF
jgi:hypothetical protein